MEEEELNLIDDEKGGKLLEALENKNYDEAKKLLADPKTNADITDEEDFDRTPITLAIESRKSDIVKLILEHPTFKNFGEVQIEEYIELAGDDLQVIDVIEKVKEERTNKAPEATRDFLKTKHEGDWQAERDARMAEVKGINSSDKEKAKQALLQGGRFAAPPREEQIQGIDKRRMDAAKTALEANLRFAKPSMSESASLPSTEEELFVANVKAAAGMKTPKQESRFNKPTLNTISEKPIIAQKPSMATIAELDKKKEQKPQDEELAPAFIKYLNSRPAPSPAVSEQENTNSIMALLSKFLTSNVVDKLKQGRLHKELTDHINNIKKANNQQDKASSINQLNHWCAEVEKKDNSPTLKNFLNMIKHGCKALVSSGKEHKEAIKKMNFYKDALTNASKNVQEAIGKVKKVLKPSLEISGPIPHNKSTSQTHGRG